MTRDELLKLCGEPSPINPVQTPAGTYFVGTHGIGRIERWADANVIVVGWPGVWEIDVARSTPPTKTETPDGTPICLTPMDYEDMKVAVISSTVAAAAEEMPVQTAEPEAPAPQVDTMLASGKDEFDVLYEAWFSGLPAAVKERWATAVAAPTDGDPAVLLMQALLAAYKAGRPVARAVVEARAMLGLFIAGDAGGTFGPLMDPVHEIGRTLE